jgi:hypothetical protein
LAARRPAPVVLVVAAVVTGVLVIACSDRGARPLSDSVADKFDAPAMAPAPPNAAARAIMAGSADYASVTAGKSVAEARPRSADGSTAAEPGMPAATAVALTSAATSMIVRNGTASIEVDSLDAAIARVRLVAGRLGGFVANTAIQGGRDQARTASLEVKIPAERFDDALTGLTPIGKVESVNVNAEDVSEEFVDISARVENAHRLEARIIDLLANRTGKLQDVLSVEHELARVREEIERYEGRLRFLKTRAAMSTLTIAVHERAPIIVPVAGDGPILVAFRQAWSNFVGVVAAFVASLGVLIPLGALALVGWLVVRRWLPPWHPPTPPTPAGSNAVASD